MFMFHAFINVKKTILTIVLFSLSLLAFGQMPVDSASHHFVYTGVVKVDSLNVDAIFNSSKEWLVRHLKSSDNNVNLTDKESKSLTATGNIHLENRSGLCAYKDINLNFKFSVFVKEGRYKYIVENFYCSYAKDCGQYGRTPESMPFEELDFGNSKKEKVYTEANTKMLELINDLEKFIKSKTGGKKDDW